MSLDELRATEEAFITPKVAAKFLGCSPQLIRQMAKDEPDKLSFPVQRVGNRTKIPKEAFIRFMEGGQHGRK